MNALSANVTNQLLDVIYAFGNPPSEAVASFI